MLLILAVAAAFRLWQLASVPPGLFGDEAVNGLDALDVLAGRARIFYPANYGREGLAMLLFAGAIHAWGPTALALRIPTALAGSATALATYWLGRELLTGTRYRGALVPLLAALLLEQQLLARLHEPLCQAVDLYPADGRAGLRRLLAGRQSGGHSGRHGRGFCSPASSWA